MHLPLVPNSYTRCKSGINRPYCSTLAVRYATEGGDTLLWFFNVFKQLNKNWDAIKIVMADTELKERQVENRLLSRTSQKQHAALLLTASLYPESH